MHQRRRSPSETIAKSPAMTGKPLSPTSARPTSWTSPSNEGPKPPPPPAPSTPVNRSRGQPPDTFLEPRRGKAPRQPTATLHPPSSILYPLFPESRLKAVLQTMSPLAPAILLFEKSPRWEAELKRRFHAGQV